MGGERTKDRTRNLTARIQITGSLGVTEFNPQDAGFQSVVARADAAPYGAKLAGHNQVRFVGERIDPPGIVPLPHSGRIVLDAAE